MLPLVLALAPLLAPGATPPDPSSVARAAGSPAERPVEVWIAAIGAEGDLLVDGWSLRLRSLDAEGRAGNWSPHRIDPAAGGVALELEPGRHEAQLLHVTGLASSVTSFRVRRSTPRSVLLRYARHDPERSLTVDLVVRQRLVDLEHAQVFARRGGERFALRGGRRTWYHRDLAPGLYEIEVDSPRTPGWRSEPIPTGARSRLELRSAASLRVVVRDLRAGIAVLHPTGILEPGGAVLNSPPEREPGVAFASTVAGDLELTVSARGYSTRRLSIDDLQVGELRTLEVELARAASVAVDLVDGSGAPVPGVGLELDWRRRLPDGGVTVPWTYPAVTDEDGAVHWHTVPPGVYVLRCPGSEDELLELRPGARIERVRVLGDDG